MRPSNCSISSKKKQREGGKAFQTDRTGQSVCVHVCVCVSLNNQNKQKKIVTEIPILMLPRLRMELPFPLLAVIPSKTITEGHKAFY